MVKGERKPALLHLPSKCDLRAENDQALSTTEQGAVL
jgi:hypothetical protein